MAVVLQFPIGASAGIELRIAHHKPVPDTFEMTFPNQRIVPVYVEKCGYIAGNELISARLIQTEEGYFPYAISIELKITASKKLNRLAAKDETIGVGVFKHGQPVQLIQVVQPVDDDALWWTGFETQDEAEEILELFKPRQGTT